ncbi:Tn3 family transposase [Streptomyces yangpuensis]|uniref:Tn3 family transposase n=1 Tax=Streptomyces yangpuensis TaxID=1648182 RepID=UPI003828B7AB
MLLSAPGRRTTGRKGRRRRQPERVACRSRCCVAERGGTAEALRRRTTAPRSRNAPASTPHTSGPAPPVPSPHSAPPAPPRPPAAPGRQPPVDASAPAPLRSDRHPPCEAPSLRPGRPTPLHPAGTQEPPPPQHATDTHGVTLVNFGLFDLVGKQLSPRIRDLGKITLYRMGAKTDYEERFPKAGRLLTKKANLDLIADHWDDLLRLAGSLKYGHATASLIVGKLSASARQNALAAALKEYGAIRRTIYAAKYLSDEGYRRKIARQLNKGGSLHVLRRRLHYAREGKVTRRQPEQQNEQAWCLTVLTNAVVCWHTWAWPSTNCAAPAARWTPRSWHTSRWPAARWSPTAAPPPSTTNTDSHSSTTRDTGLCGPWPPTIPQPGCRPANRATSRQMARH